MYNDDGVENALENKNYSFSLFCVKNLFISKVASLKLMLQILRSLLRANETGQCLKTILERLPRPSCLLLLMI